MSSLHFFQEENPENLIIQLTRFTIIGGITASLDYLLLLILVEWFKLNYLL